MVIMVLIAQVAFVLDSAIGSSKDVPTFVAMIPLTTVIIMSIAFTVAYLVISAQTKKTTNAQ
ncbi:MAG: hypothetical protein DRQ78_01155 [Epsilonproteobacteria bacterium]|nr:MAG: hypothetical protein DRQ78_01155 [Campylobacterota bacterium]